MAIRKRKSNVKNNEFSNDFYKYLYANDGQTPEEHDKVAKRSVETVSKANDGHARLSVHLVFFILAVLHCTY